MRDSMGKNSAVEPAVQEHQVFTRWTLKGESQGGCNLKADSVPAIQICCSFILQNRQCGFIISPLETNFQLLTIECQELFLLMFLKQQR